MDFTAFLAAGFHVFVVLAELLLEYLKVLAWPAAALILAMLFRRPLIGVLARLRKAAGFGASVELLESEARELADESAQVLEQEQAQEKQPREAEQHRPAQVDDVNQTKEEPDNPPPAPNPQPPSPDRNPDQATTEITTQDQSETQPDNRSIYRFPNPAMPPIDPAMLTESLRKAIATMNFDSAIRSSLRRRPLSEFSSPNITRGAMLDAWASLEKAARDVGRELGLPPVYSRNIASLTRELTDRGLVSDGTADVGYRLFKLRNKISHGEIEDDELTPAVRADFVESTVNLTTVLKGVYRNLTNDPDSTDSTED